jgi:hypothetical protein
MTEIATMGAESQSSLELHVSDKGLVPAAVTPRPHVGGDAKLRSGRQRWERHHDMRRSPVAGLMHWVEVPGE